MKIKHFLSTMVVAFMLSATSFSSFAIDFGGGGSDGQYIKIAGETCNALGKIFDCNAVETGGSGDNMTQLENGTLDFGLSMGALAKQRIENDPAFASKVEVVRYVAGEILFVYGKPDIIEAYVNWQGVLENAFLASFAIPPVDSGDAMTFADMQKDSPLADAETKHYASRDEQIQAVVSGEVQLGFAAQFANPKNSFFKSLDDNGLVFMPVVDFELALQSELYGVKAGVTVTDSDWTTGKWKATAIETMYVPVAILARKSDLYEGRAQKIQNSAIKRIQALDEVTLLPNEGWLTKFMNEASVMTGDALVSLQKKAKEAAASVKKEALGG